MAIKAAVAVATLTVLYKASARRAIEPVSHHASILMPSTRMPMKMLALAIRTVADINSPKSVDTVGIRVEWFAQVGYHLKSDRAKLR